MSNIHVLLGWSCAAAWQYSFQCWQHLQRPFLKMYVPLTMSGAFKMPDDVFGCYVTFLLCLCCRAVREYIEGSLCLACHAECRPLNGSTSCHGQVRFADGLLWIVIVTLLKRDQVVGLIVKHDHNCNYFWHLRVSVCSKAWFPLSVSRVRMSAQSARTSRMVGPVWNVVPVVWRRISTLCGSTAMLQDTACRVTPTVPCREWTYSKTYFAHKVRLICHKVSLYYSCTLMDERGCPVHTKTGWDILTV